MRILTWNIQCGLGCDGRVDLRRIADVARAMGDPDVLCLQEISQGFAPATADADQVAELASLFPDHTPVFGPAVEMAGEGGRMRAFGNLILSRLPVLRIERHLLPWPVAEGVRSMRRQAVSVLVDTPAGPLHVLTTHLEFHSDAHRAAQVERLIAIVGETLGHDARSDGETSDGPYRSPPAAIGLVMTGDFNFGPKDRLHCELHRSGLADAWAVVYPDRAHAPTCGIFDRKQWPQGPHCRDFIWLSEGLAGRLSRIEVNIETDASDHQPVVIELSDGG